MSLLVLHCCLLRKEGARLSFPLCQEVSQLPCSSPRGVLEHNPSEAFPPHFPGEKGGIQEQEKSSPETSP